MTLSLEKVLLLASSNFLQTLIQSSIDSHPDFNRVHMDRLDSIPEALKEMSIKSYDMIIIDCESFAESPPEILIQVRALQKETPLMLINKPGAERTAITCLKHGADHYLAKNQGWENEISSVIESCLEEYEKKRSQKTRMVLLESEMKRLKEKALLDETTSFYSMQYFKSVMSRELKRASRHGLSMACLMLDVGTSSEVLKKIKQQPLNPVYQKLSLLLRSLVRSSDIWARISENRFVALLPHTSGREARHAIHRINSEIAENQFNLNSTNVPLSLSWGLAEFDKNKVKDEGDFLKLAESSLIPWNASSHSPSTKPL